jgi:hypothetical protein
MNTQRGKLPDSWKSGPNLQQKKKQFSSAQKTPGILLNYFQTI